MTGRAVVVGAGIAGLSSAFALARRGWVVEVVEQGPVPNPAASSCDEHRIIRHAYGPLRGYGRMMPAAFAAWDDMFEAIGERLMVRTDAVFVLRGDDLWARESAAVMAETGAVIRPLGKAELAKRLPMIETRGVVSAFATEGDGVLFASRILAALAMHLAALGVRFRAMTRVTEVDPVAGRVHFDGGALEADHVVVAAGPWIASLLPAFQGDALPSRQAVVYLAPPAELAAAWAAAPVIVDFADGVGTYAIPPRSGTRLKLGDHLFTLEGDPDGDRVAAPADLERLLVAASESFRDFGRYRVLEARSCFYTVREGERFLLRQIGDRATVVSACSGHGFKFGPLIGAAAADLASGVRNAADVEAWAAGAA